MPYTLVPLDMNDGRRHGPLRPWPVHQFLSASGPQRKAYKCSICLLRVDPWQSRAEDGDRGGPATRSMARPALDQGPTRCPDCYHFNDVTQRDEFNPVGAWFQCRCSERHPLVHYMRKCECLCLCHSGVDDQSDGDYETTEEADDDVHSRMPEAAVQVEHRLAQNYGQELNMTGNAEQDSEREYYFEAIGHYGAGHRHDAQLREESSLANPQNIITQIEVRHLDPPLDPWELGAIRDGTSRTDQEIERIFPDEMNQHFPAASSDTSSEDSSPPCEQCARYHSEEFWVAVRQDTITFCQFCHLAHTPQFADEDPDLTSRYRPSTGDVMRICFCRCTCLLQSPEPALMDVDGQVFPRARSFEQRLSPRRNPLRSRPSGSSGESMSRQVASGRIFRSHNLVSTTQEARGALLRSMSTEKSVEPIERSPDSSREPQQAHQVLRDLTGLEMLRFSHDDNEDSAIWETVQRALRDAARYDAIPQGGEIALRYIEFAINLCRYSGAGRSHNYFVRVVQAAIPMLRAFNVPDMADMEPVSLNIAELRNNISDFLSLRGWDIMAYDELEDLFLDLF